MHPTVKGIYKVKFEDPDMKANYIYINVHIYLYISVFMYFSMFLGKRIIWTAKFLGETVIPLHSITPKIMYIALQ